MKFTRNPAAEDAYLASMWNEMYEPDRQQPSVTGMVYCLTKTYYENQYEDVKAATPSRETLMLFATGLALEKVMLGRGQRDEKGVYEGIGWHTDSSEDGLVEVKSTRISLKNAPERYSNSWRRQWMAYAKVKGVTKGTFVVLHIVGDYSPPFPDLAIWDVEATQAEIDENWAWLQDRADIYTAHKVAGEPPAPFTYNEPWECATCSWKMVCDLRASGQL